jgi:hypothetical protein
MGIILTTTSEEDKWVKFYARVLFVCIVLVFVVGKEFYFFFCLLLFLLSSITLRGG